MAHACRDNGEAIVATVDHGASRSSAGAPHRRRRTGGGCAASDLSLFGASDAAHAPAPPGFYAVRLLRSQACALSGSRALKLYFVNKAFNRALSARGRNGFEMKSLAPLS